MECNFSCLTFSSTKKNFSKGFFFKFADFTKFYLWKVLFIMSFFLLIYAVFGLISKFPLPMKSITFTCCLLNQGYFPETHIFQRNSDSLLAKTSRFSFIAKSKICSFLLLLFFYKNMYLYQKNMDPYAIFYI